MAVALSHGLRCTVTAVQGCLLDGESGHHLNVESKSARWATLHIVGNVSQARGTISMSEANCPAGNQTCLQLHI